MKRPLVPAVSSLVRRLVSSTGVFPQADLSCRNTKESVGTLYTRSNHLTLEYKTDAWGTSKNGFRMVITAFKHVTKDMVGECG